MTGMLMFGKNPQAFPRTAQCYVRAARFKGKMEAAGLRRPVYRDTGNSVIVTLYGPGDRWMKEKEAKYAELNARQKKAMEYVEAQGQITNRIYRELNDVSHDTAHVELLELREKGLLKQEGRGRGVKYLLAI